MNLKKDTIIYGIPSAFRGLIAFLLLPFFTRVLTPDEYGVFTMLTLYNLFLFIIFNFGLSNSIGPIYFKDDRLENKGLVISNSLFIAFFSSTLIFFSTYFFNDKILSILGLNLKFKYALIIYSLSTIFKILSLPFDNFLKFESKSVFFSASSIISIGINFFITAILILQFDMGIFGFIYGNIFGDFFFLLSTMIYSSKKIILKFNFTIIKDLIKVGFPMIPSGFVVYLFNEHQRFILEDLSGLSSLGVLTVILSICSVTGILFNAFGTAWFPFFMSYKNKFDRFTIIFEKLRMDFIIVFGFICSLFIVFYDSFVFLILPKEYVPKVTLAIGIVSSQFFYSYATLFYPIFYFKEKLIYILFSQIISLIISLPLTYFLISFYDLNGLALSYIFSNLIIMISLYFSSILLIRVRREKWAYSLIKLNQIRPLLIYLVVLISFFIIDFKIQAYNYLKAFFVIFILITFLILLIKNQKGIKLNYYEKHL